MNRDTSIAAAPSPPVAAGADETPARGRLCLVLAAVLWSLSGALTKALTEDTFLGLNVPPLESLVVAGRAVPVQIACYRILFAGLVLLPTLRPRQLRFRPLMLVMLGCFTVMNALFITAMALGSAANAIFLQYSAPLWMYLAAIFWLGEKPDRRSSVSLAIGLCGIVIIVAGGWHQGELVVVGIALASGLFYAAVIVFLRVLRDLPAGWLTVWNHLLGGLLLVPVLWTLQPPTPTQYVALFLFGAVQMGLPYWLMARGLRTVSPQEAGTITLLEPILNPLWAYLVSPRTEVPHPLTFIGGAVILSALAWRYWPRRTASQR